MTNRKKQESGVGRWHTIRLTMLPFYDKKDHEIDLVAEVNGEIIPFEVKYCAQNTGAR